MTLLNLPALSLSGFYSTNELVPTTLKVDLSTATWSTIMRVVVPVAAGDLLDVSAWFKVTNDLGYNVGVGAHLWAYDVDDGAPVPRPAESWWRLDPDAGSVGMNVTPDMHHLTLPVALPYQVPDDWPDGHRITIALRADAHSTAWKPNHSLTVDQVGRLTARRYTTV
ncbi:hypothetical protein ACFW9O_24915 [Streptomyces sp. NPDC059499]|uniref:hypothetical protein n=1 Tax=Streptomyces sp. NPDC059499 TaxID=3346852 RepID=UPI0036891454